MSSGDGLAFLEALGPQKIRPGLSRTRALLGRLGHPERSFRSVLVAGTNGKGSTAAFLSSLLLHSGLRVGLYTSPHLIRVTERVRLNDRDISSELLDEVLHHVSKVAGPGLLLPSYFEALTVAAFEIFKRARVDIAIVEVGIGGRLDATNVLEPDLSVVTNVGADHLEVLGPTLEEVAREKAGIFRSGRPALTAEAGAPLSTLREVARELGADLTYVPPVDRYGGISPLVGRHQMANLGLALAAASQIVPIDEKTTRSGVEAVRWPGRLQSVRRPGKRPLLLDGAHNPDGARSLAAWLDDSGLSGRIDLIFGGLADKNMEEVFRPLRTRVDRIVLTAPSSPRAESPSRLGERLGILSFETEETVELAIARLDRESPGREAPVLVSGSLFLVGDVLAALEKG